ncbi:MAG: phage virion morphogenesis protein [Gammaproteobacteria bacterium]|nr:phage virion morphogenesis protein [Gammaproteobacteria bacterium]
MTIRGDFQKTAIFKRKLGRLDPMLRELSANLAEETIHLIREGFQDEKDPYGVPWAPLRLREGRILQDTGGLRNSWHRQSSKSGFRVFSGKQYAIYHQRGTGIYGPSRKRITPIRATALKLGRFGFAKSVAGTPARRMVPENGVLPVTWRRQYEQIAQFVLKKAFR